MDVGGSIVGACSGGVFGHERAFSDIAKVLFAKLVKDVPDVAVVTAGIVMADSLRARARRDVAAILEVGEFKQLIVSRLAVLGQALRPDVLGIRAGLLHDTVQSASRSHSRSAPAAQFSLNQGEGFVAVNQLRLAHHVTVSVEQVVAREVRFVGHGPASHRKSKQTPHFHSIYIKTESN